MKGLYYCYHSQKAPSVRPESGVDADIVSKNAVIFLLKKAVHIIPGKYNTKQVKKQSKDQRRDQKVTPACYVTSP